VTTIPVTLEIDGTTHRLEIEPQETLLEVLRNRLGMKGTKANCEEGECGACTVLVNREPVNSCLLLAVRAQGSPIVTIEGLAQDGRHSALLEAFVEAGAVQCGYCSPGFLIAAAALLDANPSPSDDEIASAVSGNICRCTGYTKILHAIHLAASRTVP
jgi:aerobic-type carbon monoxide dehydrogenase small subunit (CoxS/CutS family)